MNTRLLRSYSSIARAARDRARVGAIVLCAALLLTAALPVTHAAVTPTAAPAPAPLLQFTAGGHVIGFQPTQVVMASFDHALRIEFVGTAGVTPVAASADAASSSDGRTLGRAQPLGVVTYPDLWRGIRVEYRASEGGIVKSTYTLAPGADVTQIRLRYNVPVELQSDGSLQFPFGRGYISESAPIAWQEIDGTRVPVEVAFAMAGDEVGFRLGAYDPRYPLTIDPNYLWHTFYGSSSHWDEGHAIAVDAGGNVYITGFSEYTWQGDGNADPIHPYSGSFDIFVLKLNSAGAYQWHTFYGSADGFLVDDSGLGIALDASGNVYVTGTSPASWQGDGDADPLHPHSGSSVDIFVLKLNSNGVYQWHTFYGTDPYYDGGHGIAVDGSGNVYITGLSNNTWQGDRNTAPLHPYSSGGDIFVLKLNSAGAYQWHTFYGSATVDRGEGIAVDGGGNVYITGESRATWQGDGGASPIHPYTGDYDICVLKLNSSGAYQWHTFYGSADEEDGYGIAVDGSSNVYITGRSRATWQGDGNADPLHPYSGGNDDIFVLKLNSAGAYQWHTFYGSARAEIGYGIAVDGSRNVYITGVSFASWGSPLHPYSGSDDICVLKLNSSGAYQWHTFYGSADEERGRGIAVAGNGNVYVTGPSWDTWQGDGNADPLHPHSSGGDIFVLKLGSTLPPSGSTLYLPLIRRDAP